jgi:hypothetical protein
VNLQEYIDNEYMPILLRSKGAKGKLTQESLNYNLFLEKVHEEIYAQDGSLTDKDLKFWSCQEEIPIPIVSKAILVDGASLAKEEKNTAWPVLITEANVKQKGELN